MMNRFQRAQLARISDSYKTSQRRIAREKSRSDKPEDIFAQSFVSTLLAAFVDMLACFFNFFRHNEGTSPSQIRHHSRGTPSNGSGQHVIFISDPPVKHCLRSDMNAKARSERRKLRKYCLRGYGYVTPENEVEVIRNGRHVKAAKV
jgi:hypothetical protein